MNTPSNTTTQILESLNWRYATKSFDTTKKLTQDQVSFVKEAMRLSPSSYGIQAWKFVEIKTPETRQKIKEIGWNQGQYTEASNLFAFCTYTDPVTKGDDLVNTYVEEISKQRDVSVESLEGYKAMMVNAMKNGNTSGDPTYSQYWLDDQLYIALGQTMTACALAGIDTCAMEGFDITKANEVLDLTKDGLRVKCFLAVGHRNPQDKYSTTKKVRNPIGKVFLER
jgi:nitroreductase / dihydropteridine reductase